MNTNIKLEIWGKNSIIETQSKIGGYYISLCLSEQDNQHYYCINNANTGDLLSRSFIDQTEAYLFVIAYNMEIPFHLAEFFAEINGASLNKLKEIYTV